MKTAKTSNGIIKKSVLLGSIIFAMIITVNNGCVSTYASSCNIHPYVPDYTITYSDNAQVFPYSSQCYLDWNDIAGIAPDVAQAAINEIYARNGYIFKNKTKQAYYESMPGYYPISDSQDEIKRYFNDYEKANVDLLAEVRSSSEPYKPAVIVINGTTDMHPYVPDYTITYSDNAQVFPYSSQYYLSWNDIAGIAPDVAQAAINEIYARNGYIFKNNAKQAYYESMPGYYPISGSQDEIRSYFNDYERANVELLSKIR